ncbi:hypothetical protein R1flu_008225 [Riccia fluitans]|uniref:Uncharacterized protein n=1 Tax=Riccia fluitans TaxID=41844 RepID=A0ABD1YB97_9MARC
MALGSGGGGRDRRRRDKSPELPEEGELMPEVPALPPKKGRPGPSQIPEERMAHVIENAEMRHAWKASQDPLRFGFGRNLDEIQERLTKYVKSIPGHLLEQYELWLKSSQFESWTSERETFGLPYRLRTEEYVRQV